jgi:hypothetical protein
MVLTGFLAIALLLGNWLGFRDGWHLKTPDWWDGSANNIGWAVTMLLLATGLFGYLHFQTRSPAYGLFDQHPALAQYLHQGSGWLG